MRATQRQSFWRLLRLFRVVRFKLRKSLLLGSEKYISANTAGRILAELVWITLPMLLLGLGTAAVLLLGNLYLPIWRWPWMPIPLWHLGDRDGYATFLGTISGIGGVLIGLYYAGLTAVSSATYARAPGVLRTLLVRHPVGKLYMQLLAYTTFVSLSLLAFSGVGFSPIPLAVPLLTLLSGVAILSFVQLGQQAFYFFDPTRLAGSIFVDLERWVKRVTVASRFWNDPSFQSHANRQADAALKALTTLANYAALQKYLRSEAIADLAISTVGFLHRYAGARRLIPAESKWYPSEYQHPDFYTAGDLQIQMAVQLSGSVQPVAVAEAGWVEDAALPVFSKALEANLREGAEAQVFRVLEMLSLYVERLSGLWEVEEALAIAERVTQAVAPFAFTTSGGSEGQRSWRLGLVEYLCLLPIKALLGFVNGLESAKVGAVRAMLGKVRWRKAETLYRAGFPRFVLPTLEWLRPRLDFEALAERREVTPPWFIEQAIVKDYINALHKCVDLFLGVGERFYGSLYQRSTGAKLQWAAAIVLNRQGEFILKLQANFEEIAANEGEYQTTRTLQDMVGWPSGQADAFSARITEIERAYEVVLAKEARDLVGIERPPDVPDFAGEFLLRTALTVLQAIFRDDATVLRTIFPPFFEASVKKVVGLLPSGDGGNGVDALQQFNVAMGPLLDLVELSGYAILVSELRQTPELWNVARSLWDRYLGDDKDGPARMQFLRNALRIVDVPTLGARGEVLRTGWRMQIFQLLKDLPPGAAPSGEEPYGAVLRRRVEHASALVRVLARRPFGGFYRGIDIFVAVYFASLEGNDVVARELRSHDLIAQLQREHRRGAAGERSGGNAEEAEH
jgi:hypothetical protein